MTLILPTQFLPHLPRTQSTYSPLRSIDLLAHIAVLRRLYVPPIHGGIGNSGTNVSDEDHDEDQVGHLDSFERDWAQKWLEGLFRRAQTWIEENDLDSDEEERPSDGEEKDGDGLYMEDVEKVLSQATAALAMMAGTSAAGSLTRHLLFPIHPDLAPALRSLLQRESINPNLSPDTQTFLSSISSPSTSPLIISSSLLPDITSSQSSSSPSSPEEKGQTINARTPAIPILLHDAPMGDHLSVGVQTWGSAILLGRKMALEPSEFGLSNSNRNKGVRILELGAGTGLLSILCRKLLDIQALSSSASPSGLVVATDFLPSVLDNLKICVDLNFPSLSSPHHAESKRINDTGIHIAKLDWTTFPAYMVARHNPQTTALENEEEMERFIGEPFDLVLASDCVYDPTHAKMLREVARWVLRLPDENVRGDEGGTFHILSPLRPTFAPELESIDTHFPTLSSYTLIQNRSEADGEGLGIKRRLKLGVRGDGKRSVQGRKGEGRVDETLGYWWWEVGWG